MSLKGKEQLNEKYHEKYVRILFYRYSISEEYIISKSRPDIDDGS